MDWLVYLRREVATETSNGSPDQHHRKARKRKIPGKIALFDGPWQAMARVRPVGFEPTTYGLEVRCSIQLSYGRKMTFFQCFRCSIEFLTKRVKWVCDTCCDTQTVKLASFKNSNSSLMIKKHAKPNKPYAACPSFGFMQRSSASGRDFRAKMEVTSIHCCGAPSTYRVLSGEFPHPRHLTIS